MERFLTRHAEVTEVKDVTNNINIKMIKMRFGSRESDGKMEQALKAASFWCYSLFTLRAPASRGCNGCGGADGHGAG